MPSAFPSPFRRVVLTGVENSGKSTLARALATHLQWPLVDEAARTQADVRDGKVTLDTFDDLHARQTEAAATAAQHGHPGVICDTGDLVLKVWSEALDAPWHPLTPPWPPVDLYLLCPPLSEWEPDPLRTLPRLEDRLAVHAVFQAHLTHRAHLVVEGATVEARLAHVLSQWPW